MAHKHKQHTSQSTLQKLENRENNAIRRVEHFIVNNHLSAAEYRHLLYHLIGTDRSMGILFPEFFLDEGFIENRKDIQNLFDLFLASRAYLIAHDATHDCDRSGGIRSVLRDSINNFREWCVESLAIIVKSPTTVQEIMRERDEVTEQAYRSDFSFRMPDAIFSQERCAYWFLVFDALIARGISEKLIKRKKEQFNQLLFLLQLADDFADMETDLLKPNNCNLLAWSMEKGVQQNKNLLFKYTLLAIWKTAETIIKNYSPLEPIRIWAEEVSHLIISQESKKVDEYTSVLFGDNWPEDYLTPSKNENFKIVRKMKVKFQSINGVFLSAESINAFVSRRVWNRLNQRWDIS